MKRSIGAAGAAMLLAVVLSACGGGGSKSGSASSFCDRVKGAQISFSAVDFTNLDEAKKAASALRDIANTAPSDIKPDAQKLADALDKFAKGDVAEFLNADKQKELITASDNVAKFVKDECGIDINT
jgi:hypothetical protein